MDKVPTIELAHLSDTQKKALIIADNKLALNADWDTELLQIELNELISDDFALDILGFDKDELDALLNVIEPNAGLTDEDAVPELPEEPKTKLGDIYILGNHRLMCGDSTSIDDAEKLMDGLLADLVFTDPPYNVDYSGRGANNLGTIKNDNMSAEDFEQFCRDIFTTYSAIMKPLACIYVCHPDSASAPKIAFEKTFAEQFKKSSTIIWMKQSAGMGWQDYRAQHEPILYGWKEGKGSHFNAGDRTKTSIWKIGRDAQSSYVHPTQKPVCLPEEAILNSSKGSDCVVDLFGGSGSTLIACEKSGRVNRTMELDPKYCDVIVKRWEDFTGKQAVLSEL
jgi:DNA modification methylase